MHLLSPNGKKTPKGDVFLNVIGFLYGVRGNDTSQACSQESRSSSNSRVAPSDPGTELGTETVEVARNSKKLSLSLSLPGNQLDFFGLGPRKNGMH